MKRTPTTVFVFPDLPETDMIKRGKVLRDPRTGPGLLMIEGRQYWFCLEGVWKSQMPPTPGLAVDVKLDHARQIIAITAVSESQLAEEQAERSVGTAKAAGVKILRKIADKCGLPNLLRR
ncbi:MAG: hypothetical protein DMG73_16915 [Acidobacteria bacterium]|nr:MAG: hypothetical protein DMG73_16915 [Acidobacteriota bacterium]